MATPSWLQRLHAAGTRHLTRRTRKAPPRARPRIHVLEDRLLLSTFWVTNTGDNGGVNPAPGAGTGTLRQAIIDANADSATLATIDFNIASSGMQTISLSAALPTITHAVVIDGTTEPGWQANSLPLTGASAGDNAIWTVTLDGSLLGSTGDGLAIAAGGSTVQGLLVQNFSSGIHLTTSGNDRITGNYLTSTTQGVFLDNVANCTVGGTTAGARNLFASNNNGVQIQGTGATGNQVQGNFIGTDGSQLLTSGVAVNIWDASDNIIGGTASEAGNVIGSSYVAIYLTGDDSSIPVSGNLVEGNYIGLNAAGTAGFPQGLGHTGIVLLGNVSDTTIGGATAPARNVLSGWSAAGVYTAPIFDFSGTTATILAAPTGLVVESNYIGTNAAGSAALVPNEGSVYGIWTTNGTGSTTVSGNLISGLSLAILLVSPGQLQGNLIGTDATGTQPIPNGYGIEADISGDLIGGTTPGAGNTIAFNNGPAVSVGSPGPLNDGILATGVRIQGNSIYGNSGPGIDNLDQKQFLLGSPLFDANWPGGPFTGTNTASFSGLSLTQTGSTLSYSGTLTGLASTRYSVSFDVFSPDGTEYFGSYYTFLTTDATGQVTFTNLSYPAPSGYPTNQGAITAYATAHPPHSQGNYEQNFPVLASASSGSSTVVSGTLNGAANTTFTLDVYASPSADPSGFGQGQYYLGNTPVTTDSNGNASFSADFSAAGLPGGVLPAGWSISATATDPGGNTSQFSADVTTAAATQTLSQFL
jgi:titin